MVKLQIEFILIITLHHKEQTATDDDNRIVESINYSMLMVYLDIQDPVKHSLIILTVY